MLFNANQTQIVQLVTNAINASEPMGMGILHFQPKDYSTEDILSTMNISILDSHNYLNCDYYAGRMVKLRIFKEKNGMYKIHDSLDVDYQSWIKTYPTVKNLLESVGIEGIEEDTAI